MFWCRAVAVDWLSGAEKEFSFAAVAESADVLRAPSNDRLPVITDLSRDHDVTGMPRDRGASRASDRSAEDDSDEGDVRPAAAAVAAARVHESDSSTDSDGAEEPLV